MAFIFFDRVGDVVRSRGLTQSFLDRLQNKQRGDNAPKELPNLTTHGITSNGTYFLFTLVYKKDLLERQKIKIFNLIEAYANTKEHAERVKLKVLIKEACGEQVEGIAILFSDDSEVYGFVTGNRVKAALRGDDRSLLKLDAAELFSYSEGRLDLKNEYLIFILENEEENIHESIQQYLLGNQKDDTINTDVINSIKYAYSYDRERREDMSEYLNVACKTIKNPVLSQQVNAVCEALRALSYDEWEIQYNATVLTIQLLHSQDDEKRKQLLADYTKLASTLYGSRIPSLMILGISLFILAVSYLAVCSLSGQAIPSLIIFLMVYSIITGIISTVVGKNEFFNEHAKKNRTAANSLFNLKDTLNDLPAQALISEKIQEPANP